eukprot:SAG11_NODE_1636_length_4537_cov_2.667868_1_plen_35_part_10
MGDPPVDMAPHGAVKLEGEVVLEQHIREVQHRVET